VAVGSADGTDAYIVTSEDGVTWEERANPKNFNLLGVCWGGGLFVAVGAQDGTDAYIVTSEDGVTWEERANSYTGTLNDVTFGGGVYVAVGNDIDDILYSANGTTWSISDQNETGLPLYSVAWNGTIFCAVGAGDSTNPAIQTSPDGINWTERTAIGSADLYDVIAIGNIFVAVGFYLSDFRFYAVTSPDGINWEERSTGQMVILQAIAWSGKLFCTVGDVGASYPFILTSLRI
jgi:hypothetical protein